MAESDLDMAKKDIEKALKELKAAGYKVSTPVEDLVVKTFKVHKDVAAEFYKKIAREDLKVQDAIEEAMKDWVKK